MNWSAIGAIAGIVGVVVAVHFGLNPPTAPPPLPPTPPPVPPIGSACPKLRLPACPDKLNNIATEIISDCSHFISKDDKNPSVFNLLGRAYQAVGRLNEAESAFEKQLVIGQSLNDNGVISLAYFNIARIQLMREAFDKAEFYTRKSLEFSTASKIAQAAGFITLGDIFYRRSDYLGAVQNFRSSILLFGTTKDKMGLAGAYTGLGFSLLRQGDRSGCSYLNRVKSIYSEINCFTLKNRIEKYIFDTRC